MKHGLTSLYNHVQSWHPCCFPVSRIVSLESEKEKCWRDKSCLGEWEDPEKQDMTQRPWEKVKRPPLPQTHMRAIKLRLGGGAPRGHRNSYKEQLVLGGSYKSTLTSMGDTENMMNLKTIIINVWHKHLLVEARTVTKYE